MGQAVEPIWASNWMGRDLLLIALTCRIIMYGTLYVRSCVYAAVYGGVLAPLVAGAARALVQGQRRRMLQEEAPLLWQLAQRTRHTPETRGTYLQTHKQRCSSFYQVDCVGRRRAVRGRRTTGISTARHGQTASTNARSASARHDTDAHAQMHNNCGVHIPAGLWRPVTTAMRGDHHTKTRLQAGAMATLPACLVGNTDATKATKTL